MSIMTHLTDKIRARVLVTPESYTETQELFLIPSNMAKGLDFDPEPEDLIYELIEHGLTEDNQEVAIHLRDLNPGAIWRKCKGSYRYVIVDMKRVWRYTEKVKGKVFSFPLEGSLQLNDESKDLVVVVELSQLPGWSQIKPRIDWMTEDK